jgi:hypothetical protein
MSGWGEIYAARFGRKLTDLEYRTWEEEIANDVRDCRESEIIRAIRELGEKKRKGALKYNPTVERLISAIIHNRWIDKQAERSALMGNCSCDGGWIIVCPETDYPHYHLAVPCGCDKGRRVIERMAEDPSEVGELSQRFAEMRSSSLTEAEGREKVCEWIDTFPDEESWGNAGDFMRSYWKWKFGDRVGEYEEVFPIKTDLTKVIGNAARLMAGIDKTVAAQHESKIR